MNKYLVAAQLDELAVEAERLCNGGPATNPPLIDLWFARAHDALALFLPADAGLRSSLTSAREQYINNKLTTLPPQTVLIIRSASELNRNRRDEDLATEIRAQMQSVIAETYAQSWAFRVTVGGLFLTIGFAVFGIVQLNTLRVDVRERAEAAAKRAEQEIEQQAARSSKIIAGVSADAQRAVETQLRTEMQTHIDVTKRNVTLAAQAHIENLKQQKTPELEAALLTSRFKVASLQDQLKASERRVAELESRIGILNRGVEQMRAATNGSSILNRLNAFLDHSRGYVAGEMLALTVAVLLSAFAAFMTLRHNQRRVV